MHIITGKFRHHRIKTPQGSHTRPTSSKLRETVFNILQTQVQNAHFLDIFAGSGAMGLEALSREANSVTFIENNREAMRCLEENIKNLNLKSKTLTLFGDFEKMLHLLIRQGKSFHIIFADAPYHFEENLLKTSEILISLIAPTKLLTSGGVFFIENNREEPILDVTNQLIWVNSRKSGKTFLHQYCKT